MSESERKQRQEYKRMRKRWIWIQIIAFVLVLATSLILFTVYDTMNRTYYIEYTENGNVDYTVNLKENSFFDKDSVGSGQSYISELIENIVADFKYNLTTDSSNVGFDYSYSIDAQLIVANKSTGDYIYDPVYNIVPETSASTQGRDSLMIGTSVGIDYNYYNEIAKSFVNAYGLKDTTSTLVVTMNVKVLSTCSEFADTSNANTYFVSLNIPLVEENFSIYTTSSNTEGASNVFACTNGTGRKVLLVLTIVFAVIALLQAIALAVFVFLTRNDDINYTNKVRKILSSYRSFIQQIDGQFDVTGYQAVPVKTFKEMLNIRDTLQSPILMFENVDQTVTEFVIPTNTNILYTFEIKVDNYDEIYGISNEPVVEDDSDDDIEVVIVSEDITEEEIEAAMATPNINLDEINYIEDDDEELDEGVEVIGVVWPEKTNQNKVYRYDPNGEVLEKGDIVLVPTMDNAKNREVVRKAAVAHANHKVDPATFSHPLKKIIGVVRHRAEQIFTAMITPTEGNEDKK